MGAKSQPISPPFGHKAGLPPSKKFASATAPFGILLYFQKNTDKPIDIVGYWNYNTEQRITYGNTG